MNKEIITEILNTINTVQNPYPLDLVSEPDATVLAKKLKEILGDKYTLVEAILWVWGNYVFELAKEDIKKAIKEIE